MAPKIIGIAGTSSDCGKTTLLCDLLREFSPQAQWEAIKLTRGHYRSCGKDPHACCVSHLLGDEPLVRSGMEETKVFGKDTGRYWDAGAANVHWVIVTNDQVERGIRLALNRVQSRNVLIEGTSFLRYITTDLAVLVTRPDAIKLKPTARYALLNGLIDVIYLFGDVDGDRKSLVSQYQAQAATPVPLYTRSELSQLITMIKEATGSL
jgi:molybdopterin-guanine dinucleotide biosynthesis protein